MEELGPGMRLPLPLRLKRKRKLSVRPGLLLVLAFWLCVVVVVLGLVRSMWAYGVACPKGHHGTWRHGEEWRLPGVAACVDRGGDSRRYPCWNFFCGCLVGLLS